MPNIQAPSLPIKASPATTGVNFVVHTVPNANIVMYQVGSTTKTVANIQVQQISGDLPTKIVMYNQSSSLPTVTTPAMMNWFMNFPGVGRTWGFKPTQQTGGVKTAGVAISGIAWRVDFNQPAFRYGIKPELMPTEYKLTTSSYLPLPPVVISGWQSPFVGVRGFYPLRPSPKHSVYATNPNTVVTYPVWGQFETTRPKLIPANDFNNQITLTTSTPTNVTVTGTAATASAGSFAVTVDDSNTLTGAAGTTSAGTFINTVFPAVAGTSSTASAGSFAITVDDSAALTGAANTSAAGTFTITASANTAVTGAATTSAAGTFSIVLSPSVNLTGASTTASAGTISTTVFDSVTLTGAASTASAGTFTPTAAYTFTGASSSTALGTFIDTVFPAIAGASVTSAVGTPVESISLQFNLTGTSSTASAGATAELINPGFTGASTASAASSFNFAGGLTLTGTSTTASAGTFSYILSPSYALTGASTTASPGTLTEAISPSFNLTGVSTTASGGIIFSTVFPNLPGVAATSTAQVIQIPTTPPFSGISVTSTAGSYAPLLTYTIVGASSIANAPGFSFNATHLSGAPAVAQAYYPPEIDQALTGVFATAGCTAFDVQRTVRMNGAPAVSQIGDISISFAQLVGAGAQSDVGIFSYIRQPNLPSISVTAQANFITPQIIADQVLTGVSVRAILAHFPKRAPAIFLLTGI